ncbi:aminopeptidase N [Halovibrio salipaludis]|uniref:Aminopeptidase N n=1 Tax=Halovibrio salipaludis TaxID=2032626 RepID=A0A2A2F5F3_9GAMM|nr:aminopeptidase N [Halovibrio salipaludis]PAU80148.1 aminopeptidase N [Halovibrio salipaludis]
MRAEQPQAVHLADYRVPAFLIDHVDLRIELFEDCALVHSRLNIRRNPADESQARDLVLNGEELGLESLMLDGRPVENHRVDEGFLTVPSVPEHFHLDVTTRIHPRDNTRLEGLYQSSGMFCTQCEAEGFRRITYFPDRPDVMACYRTRIEADREAYPVLLANGNPVDWGELEDGRHQVTWEDPYPKPSYLFAMVAGDLVEKRDEFVTGSGRTIDLRMYVEARNEAKCEHALASLKKAMAWDEEVYGREYDLDIFMVVAVDDFNMGAMENKGLNIFNSSCVLASPETATDAAYDRIESIVAHEYFHNWSGNRVTCRDWFQLSLKEGFTVFRDNQFSADMGSPTVQRIDHVNMLRTAQFAEDAGPMAHPVRPDSYIEIANFYTLTVYEKGAEVVRMIHTLLGPDMFREGSDLYFARHDGQAVTTDDFVRAMEDASSRDLTQFRRWYEQAGTPELRVTDAFDAESGTYTLTIRQSCPATPGQSHKEPFHIPVRMGLIASDGEALPLDAEQNTETVLELTDTEHSFQFSGLAERPVPSLLRGFSAPVKLDYSWTRDQLMFLMSRDPDGFNRWDAGQKLAVDVILSIQQGRDTEVDPRLVEAYRTLLTTPGLDRAMVARMLALPSTAWLIELTDEADVAAIDGARHQVEQTVARALRDELLQVRADHHPGGDYAFEPGQVAARSLSNSALALLTRIGDDQGRDQALAQFDQATNMTDRLAALKALVDSPFSQEREDALARFHADWQHDPQVVEQWFAAQSGSPWIGNVNRVTELLAHPAFDWKNPNKVRMVIGVFAGRNLTHFHSPDGSGHRFLGEQIRRLDAFNPQISAQLAQPLTRWRQYAPHLRDSMAGVLRELRDLPDLSRDLYEVVTKSLGESD